MTYSFDSPGWVNLGGVGNSDLSTSVLSDGSLEVYVRGTTLNLYVNRRPPGSTRFGGYVNLGGKLTNNPVSRGFAALPASSAAAADEIIVRGLDGTLFAKAQDFTIGYSGYFTFPGPTIA